MLHGSDENQQLFEAVEALGSGCSLISCTIMALGPQLQKSSQGAELACQAQLQRGIDAVVSSQSRSERPRVLPRVVELPKERESWAGSSWCICIAGNSTKSGSMHGVSDLL